jgi:hypothetical protein
MTTLVAMPRTAKVLVWTLAAIDAAVLIGFFVLLKSTSPALAVLFGITFWICIWAALFLLRRNRAILGLLVALLPVPLSYGMAVVNVYLQH